MKKNIWNSIFISWGMIFVAAGLFVISNQQAFAARSKYDETQTVSQWRNATVTWSGVSRGTVSVGPSQWTVAGTAGTTTFDETWSATQWQTTVPGSSMGTVAFSSGAWAGSLLTWSWSNGMLGTRDNYFYQLSGLYGVSVYKFSSTAGSTFGGLVSIPTQWNISGNITTP